MNLAKELKTGPQSRADKYRVTAGAKPRQGNSRCRFVADQAIDARA
jgi:hypothetical protein